ncbi:hypothetical protein BCR33DRAFT_850162 [Rhizoclosmatium globosum]|uniref:RING-type domain-containing protein n=1 Tax=Rhizoclosmatium globosum TaxID=329046 RepID=A0A1Y2CG79_9FUNG|nr:hypothetical protein BCR33DRAFT_850162 [Rhizoclosmatium globosum]|eukprot:ORY45325.1 hypothetical protein BCR33DRAFT_850162 [Rhizoclosmatium globosum]
MSRHSKNNTSLAYFTNAEREKLEYGTRKQRMGRDSMRNFDSCFLCLQTARDPMSCTKGHLACKECYFENILNQKKEFSRMQNLYVAQQELMQKEIEARQEMLRLAEVERFEKTQTSVLGVSGSVAKTVETRVIDGKVFKGIKTPEGTIFVPDMAALDPKEREKAFEDMKELDKGAKKASLPSFWVPSLTPDATPTAIEPLPSKLELKCIASDPAHSIASFKKLVKVNFTLPKDSEKEAGAIGEPSGEKGSKVCPSCVKTFTNGSKIMIVKLCGHAVCKDCYSRFIKGAGKCHVCDGPCKTGDAFELFIEGTGFASSGGMDKLGKRVGVAFQ